jgi:hypothetical protein
VNPTRNSALTFTSVTGNSVASVAREEISNSKEHDFDNGRTDVWIRIEMTVRDSFRTVFLCKPPAFNDYTQGTLVIIKPD